MSTPCLIEADSISEAWLDVLERTSSSTNGEIGPLVVSMDFSGSSVTEDLDIRRIVNGELRRDGLSGVITVANTIFPNEMWNPERPRAELFDRYEKLYPKIKAADQRNRRGTYFYRLMTSGNERQENQLEHIITTATQKGCRRSALQASIFDPKLDQSASRQQGFPCLQHISVIPKDGGLELNAFYASQTVLEKAYGNYLGLSWLAHFMAKELGLSTSRVTIFVGIAKLCIKFRSPRTRAVMILKKAGRKA